MTAAIDLTAKQRETLLSLLRRFIPGVAVWAFGSRVQWNARPDSDLDLAVFSSPNQHRRVSALKEALAESDLPFLVDLHVWDELPERFQEVIRKEYIVIQEAEKPEDRLEAPTEWRRTALGEAVELLSGGTPSKGCTEYWGGAIPWVSAKDMKCFRIEDTEDHLTEAGAANATRLVSPGTVLVLVRGMTLLNDVPVCVVGKPMAFNQDVKALRPKPGVATDYLPYLLLGIKDRLFSLVDLAGHGTGRLNSDELKALDVVLPPIEEQSAIAHILGTLDDKIELNLKMNRALEEIAQTLFRAWFVDFEGEIDLVDSELGPVPRGWEATLLGEEFRLTMGQSPPGSTYNEEGEGLPFYQGATDFGFRYPALRVFCSEPKRIAEAGDTLVSVRAPVGRVNLAAMRCCIGRGVAALRHRSGSESYTYMAAKHLDERFERFNAEGTVFGSIGKKDFQRIPILRPPAKVVERYSEVVEPLDKRLQIATDQSRTLADLRDTLLPKLISGEIRIPEAQKALEEAV